VKPDKIGGSGGLTGWIGFGSFLHKKPDENDGLGFQFSFSFFVSPQKATQAKTSFKVFKHD